MEGHNSEPDSHTGTGNSKIQLKCKMQPSIFEGFCQLIQHWSLSTGYFIQDAADIIFSGYAKASWEFLLHHFMVSQYTVIIQGHEQY